MISCDFTIYEIFSQSGASASGPKICSISPRSPVVPSRLLVISSLCQQRTRCVTASSVVRSPRIRDAQLRLWDTRNLAQPIHLLDSPSPGGVHVAFESDDEIAVLESSSFAYHRIVL